MRAKVTEPPVCASALGTCEAEANPGGETPPDSLMPPAAARHPERACFSCSPN